MPDSQSGLRGGKKGEGGLWTDFLCVVLVQVWALCIPGGPVRLGILS